MVNFIHVSVMSSDTINVAWSLSTINKEFINQYFGKPFSSFRNALRLYEVNNCDSATNQNYFELIIPEDQYNWKLKGLKDDCIYWLEIGIKLTELEFFPLLRSERIYMPALIFASEKQNRINTDLNLSHSEKEPVPSWTKRVSTYTYYEKKDTWSTRK